VQSGGSAGQRAQMPGPLRTIGCLRLALQPARIRRADPGSGRRRCLVPAGTKGRGQPTMSTARVTAVGYGGPRCCAAPKGPPILSERSESRDRRSYFDLKKSEGRVRARSVACSASARAGQLARALILTRLWAKTPCPHQTAAPSRPSSRVRSQSYPCLRQLIRPSQPVRHLTSLRNPRACSTTRRAGEILALRGMATVRTPSACRSRSVAGSP